MASGLQFGGLNGTMGVKFEENDEIISRFLPQSFTFLHMYLHKVSDPVFVTVVKINISTGAINIVKSKRRSLWDNFNLVIYRVDSVTILVSSLRFHIIERDRKWEGKHELGVRTWGENCPKLTTWRKRERTSGRNFSFLASKHVHIHTYTHTYVCMYIVTCTDNKKDKRRINK